MRPATEQDVREFAAWHYDPPYDVYDIDMAPDEAIAHFLEPGTHCHTLFDRNITAGYCTFGHDAQVPGGAGNRFVAAVVAYPLATFDPPQLRVTIASGNIRALRVWSGVGFSEISRFTTTRDIMGSGEFATLTLTPPDHP